MRNIHKVTSGEIVMVHYSRFTSLLLALLLSLLLGLKCPTVLAHIDVATVGDSVRALETVKELPLRESKKIADHSTLVKRLRGRKFGAAADDIVPKEEEEENTGKDMTSSNKPYDTSTTKECGAADVSEVSPTHHGSSGSEDQSSMGAQELLDANAEIFRMMNKDYHAKARRKPPINNNLPQKDHGESVTP